MEDELNLMKRISSYELSIYQADIAFESFLANNCSRERLLPIRDYTDCSNLLQVTAAERCHHTLNDR